MKQVICGFIFLIFSHTMPAICCRCRFIKHALHSWNKWCVASYFNYFLILCQQYVADADLWIMHYTLETSDVWLHISTILKYCASNMLQMQIYFKNMRYSLEASQVQLVRCSFMFQLHWVPLKAQLKILCNLCRL